MITPLCSYDFGEKHKCVGQLSEEKWAGIRRQESVVREGAGRQSSAQHNVTGTVTDSWMDRIAQWLLFYLSYEM